MGFSLTPARMFAARKIMDGEEGEEEETRTKQNGKTGKIYVQAKWPIRQAFVSGFCSIKRM